MDGVDVLSFRNRFWQRLMVNVGIVLVFAAFYLRFLKRAWAQSPQCARPTTGYAGALTGQTKVWLERKIGRASIRPVRMRHSDRASGYGMRVMGTRHH